LAVEKEHGGKVFAGTINQKGVLFLLLKRLVQRLYWHNNKNGSTSSG